MLLLMYKGIESGELKTKDEKEKSQRANVKGLMALFPVIDRRVKPCQATK